MSIADQLREDALECDDPRSKAGYIALAELEEIVDSQAESPDSPARNSESGNLKQKSQDHRRRRFRDAKRIYSNPHGGFVK